MALIAGRFGLNITVLAQPRLELIICLLIKNSIEDIRENIRRFNKYQDWRNCMFKVEIYFLIILCILFTAGNSLAQEQELSQEELAKQSQNPVASLHSKLFNYEDFLAVSSNLTRWHKFKIELC